ncbi:MAG: hypothetical protein KJ882_07165 [Proteobacteria bacterium]|nr:hypothetical protein [Pseudomonadota bacterium]MBU4010530.1 hypothetical protein [Pseudomonadota bacterium]MBU4037874.1 hypothetical protein [Pseudomonadota bacterium]
MILLSAISQFLDQIFNKAIIKAFARSAAFAREAGLDGIVLMGHPVDGGLLSTR